MTRRTTCRRTINGVTFPFGHFLSPVSIRALINDRLLQQLKDLETALDSARQNASTRAGAPSKPKRFAFRRTTPASEPSPVASSSQPSHEPAASSSRSSAASGAAVSIEGLPSVPPVIVPDLSANLQDLTLSDLTDSLLDLRSQSRGPHPVRALHLHRLRRCVVLGGWIDGSVFVQDWKEGAAVLAARQVPSHALEFD